MKKKFTIILFFCTISAFAQKKSPADTTNEVSSKYRVSIPYFIITDLSGNPGTMALWIRYRQKPSIIQDMCEQQG
jgi:hypothetical protein